MYSKSDFYRSVFANITFPLVLLNSNFYFKSIISYQYILLNSNLNCRTQTLKKLLLKIILADFIK